MELKELDIKDRIINLFSEINESTAQETVAKIVEINIKDAQYINSIISVIASAGFKIDPEYIELPPIIVNLMSPGGACYAGWGICDSIRNSETEVKIVCYGMIMSMAIPILLSAKYKVAHKHTTFMIHQVSSFNMGKLKDLEEDVDETKRLNDQMFEYILKNSKIPKKMLKDCYEKKKDLYLTAEEALQYKLIDEIIE